MNQLKFIKQTVYSLKRQYGRPLDYYQVQSVSTVRTTGVKSSAEIVIPLRKAIVFPGRLIRDFVYDLAYIAANKNFTSGAYFDHEELWLLLDHRDLGGLSPQVEDYIIKDNYRYDIKEVNNYEEFAAYLCKIKKIKGGPRIIHKLVASEFVFGQTVTYVKLP